ncbi:MAG: OmpA family protein, partial [Bacteroidota bacterium]
MKTISVFIAAILVSSIGFSQSGTVFFFEYESNESTPIEFEEELLVKRLEIPFDSIQLNGHTDDTGSDECNMQLSEQRVASAEAKLLSLNVDETYIKTNYFGESAPLIDNDSEENRAKNRRVEMLIYRSVSVEEPPVMSIDTLAFASDITDNSDLYAYVKQASSLQSFSISNLKDTVIQTSGGAFIYFPENGFNTDCNTIEIRIEELKNKKAMILSNVQTVSNGQLIYSDGMMDVSAYCDDQELSLNTDEKYTMLMPAKLEEKGALGFYGVRDSDTQQLNWLPTAAGSLETFVGTSFGRLVEPKKSCRLFSWFKSDQKRWEEMIERQRNEERQRIRDKYKDVDFDQFATMTKDDAHFYVFQAERMGMINVDYFWDVDPEDMIDQRIKLAETITKDCDMMMVFNGRRSLKTEVIKTPAYFEFKNVPKGTAVQIVALKLAKKKG